MGGWRERERPAIRGALSPYAFRLPRIPHELAHPHALATRAPRPARRPCGRPCAKQTVANQGPYGALVRPARIRAAISRTFLALSRTAGAWSFRKVAEPDRRGKEWSDQNPSFFPTSVFSVLSVVKQLASIRVHEEPPVVSTARSPAGPASAP